MKKRLVAEVNINKPIEKEWKGVADLSQKGSWGDTELLSLIG